MAALSQAKPSLSLPKRYTNVSLLGVGGFGRVFRAHDSVRNLDLALKVVGSDEANWLLREFDTLRQIRHENLIRVFDWGTLPSGDAYYTMEFIDGGDWGAGFGKPQPSEQVIQVLQGIGRALAHLHSHGEIHGDLKPANVLLGDGGVVKLTDVGMGSTAGARQNVSGTPGYVAPEIWEGIAGDVRSDIYSVGVMAYEALTGRHPFAGKTIKEVVTGQLEGWVPSPRAHGVAVPASFERTIMRALERKPALRHGSVDEFLEDLGIQDRVGEILGGKIVERGPDIDELNRLLATMDASAPTLVHITGPPGIGKTSLVEEFAQRLLARGGATLRPTAPSPEGVAEAMSHAETSPTTEQSPNSATLLNVSEALVRASDEAPVFAFFAAPQGEDKRTLNFARSLGRYIWAISMERDRRGPLLICLEHETPPAELDEFERHIAIPPLDLAVTERVIAGTLGLMDLEVEVVARIHSVTGGSPGGIRALISDITGSGLLQRVAGTWRFREIGRLADLTVSGAASRWALAWGRLSLEQRIILGLLSYFPRGLAASSLERALPGHASGLPRLASSGWVRASGNTWTLASDDIRAAIADLADNQETRSAEERLLAQENGLTREERASILIRFETGANSIEEGLWAAGEAMSRGDFRLARERASRCLELSSADRALSRQATLMIAESLHKTGSDIEAGNLLERQETWGDEPATSALAIRREQLLGTIRREQGDIEGAKSHLKRAIDSAEQSGDFSALLRSHADLAEIDWWHGDQFAKEAAMERVRNALGRDYGGLRLDEERAALAYQLGSALILSGDRIGAKEVLLGGLQLAPGDYWRMRLANALVSAHYYLGDFGEALEWLDEAWRCAERGGIDAFKTRILANRAGLFYGLGRFREAVETHDLSAQWGRRTGNAAEFILARAGGSINLTLLGRYDEALGLAREAQEGAREIASPHEGAKALELQALASYYIGDYEGATHLVELAAHEAEGLGFDDVAPRLDWLKARLCVVTGDYDAAEEALGRAREVLVRTKDWEDLPGVQIEMQIVFFRRGDLRFDFGEVKRLALDAERGRARVVYLLGALAVAEIVMAKGAYDGENREFLLDALGKAEESGTAEFSWRLSHALGEIASSRSETREASARYSHAVRRLREIADHLAPEHRRLYLKTAHASRLLQRAAETNKAT